MTELMTNILTNTGLNLPKQYSEEEFFEAGQFLANIEHGLQWAVGDWYNAILWGDKQKACEKVGMNYATARQHAVVAERFEKFTRVNNLSFGHHKALAIEDLSKSQRTELLTEAAEFQWSSKRLMTERDTVLGKEPAILESKPVTDIPDPATTETNDSADIAQASSSKVHETHNLSVVDKTADEVRNESPAVYYDTRQPEQSYNATFEANKELANLKQAHVEMELKYDAEHVRAGKLEGEIQRLKSDIEKLEASALVDQATIDKLIAEKVKDKSGRKPVKKLLTNYKEGTVVEVLARFLPDGANNTNDMRSALSDGYRKANGITGKLKADDASRINDYLKTLNADEINLLIKIKKDEIRDKAKAKRLMPKRLTKK